MRRFGADKRRRTTAKNNQNNFWLKKASVKSPLKFLIFNESFLNNFRLNKSFVRKSFKMNS
jgi:hypothetical protein